MGALVALAPLATRDLPLLLFVVLVVDGVVVSGCVLLISLSIFDSSLEVNSDGCGSRLVDTVADTGIVVSRASLPILLIISSMLSVVDGWNKEFEGGKFLASYLLSVNTFAFVCFLNVSIGTSSTASSTSYPLLGGTSE